MCSNRMRRIWLLFAQTVTISLAVLFVIVTLKPQWLQSATAPSVTGRDGGSKRQVDDRPPITPSGSYAGVIAKASPAVVNVYTTKRISVPRVPLPQDPMLRHFFEQMPGFTLRRESSSLGSGVLVTDKGHVLTNFHVVEGADEIVLALSDGRQVPARVVGTDPDTDLAVLQANKLSDFQHIEFADPGSARVGDIVFAIGNPFGVGQTTTMGIVSALGRDRLGLNTYENFIQTDAAINPGNSGGALIDAHARLIGINTAIYSESGGSQGVGFAIPIDTVSQVLAQIIEFGHVRRGWLGIEPQDVRADLARAFNLDRQTGVIIAGMMRDGPAARAGLRVGDIVQSINGKAIEDTPGLMGRIARASPGETVRLGIWRSGRKQMIDVKVGMRPVRPN